MKRKLSLGATALLVLFLTIPTSKVEAQGPCFARGGEVMFGNTVYFVCPLGGAYAACAYPCRQE